jgi:hypothetical protein
VRARAVLGFLGVVALLAAASQMWLDSRPADRCDFDGAHVQPAFAVDWISSDGDPRRRFCTIECALRWKRAGGPPFSAGRFVVRDGATGEPLAAEIALYVETPSAPAGGDHSFTRSFKLWQDAQSCQRLLGGRIVPNPFVVSGDQRELNP